jgi:hypothetical protein
MKLLFVVRRDFTAESLIALLNNAADMEQASSGHAGDTSCATVLVQFENDEALANTLDSLRRDPDVVAVQFPISDENDCDGTHLSGILEEAEILVKYWAEETVSPRYDSFVGGCYGGEWKREMLASYRLDQIAKLVGRERVQQWFDEGVERFVSRQDPILWKMYCDGIEPVREAGIVVTPVRPAPAGRNRGSELEKT